MGQNFFFSMKTFFCKKILRLKKFLGEKHFWVKKKKKFIKKFLEKILLVKKNFWSTKMGVKTILGLKKSSVKKICPKILVGLTLHDPPAHPHSENSSLKIVLGCCLFVRWGRIQNFMPLRPLFIVEVEFLGGGWCDVNSNNRVKPNLRMWLCSVVVRLRFWQKFGVKLCRVNKIWVRKVFGEKKKSGRIMPKGKIHDSSHPHTENRRVKIVLGCC